ncbi:MFS transporter [Microbacterium sp. 10M-3C3]|jgi:predicted MFS family arabinose efflux permease|uniref:MFS transporter n=1 Tax=Microbacterium sp. 10M-3C3 TaxID=2483401 RepID=UPI000F62E23B|nr:MFS transporter [Microbacterium sp. 10M-3C3]
MPTTRSSSARPSGYRVLPHRAGWTYLLAASFGRLPLSMVPLAVLTLTTSTTGSIAVGGLASAAAAVGEAVGAPASGALSDRLGQRSVLLSGLVLHVSLLLALTAGAGMLPDAATVALAALVGVTLPQVGAFSRARWLVLAPDDLPAAFAFEGAVDEVAYIFGPALVGLTAAFVSPQAATLLAGGLVVAFASVFAVHPSHRLVPRRRGPRTAGQASARGRGIVVVALAGMLAMGAFFGASQTGLTSFAERAGIPDAGALLYAVMAIGSAATTLSMVLVPERVGTWARWTLAALGMACGAVWMLSAADIPGIVVASLVAGAFQGPLLLTIFRVVGEAAESGSAGVLLTLTSSGIVLGIAGGAAASGALAEAFGPVGGLAPVLGASLILLAMGAVALLVRRIRHAGT